MFIRFNFRTTFQRYIGTSVLEILLDKMLVLIAHGFCLYLLSYVIGNITLMWVSG